jgi:transposase InsO family protein
VTAHPNPEWLARQLTDACGWDDPPRYLIRDRDGAYGAAFIRRIRAMGIRDRPVSARSPWQNGYAERLIGSIRRDCLDHVVVVGERRLDCGNFGPCPQPLARFWVFGGEHGSYVAATTYGASSATCSSRGSALAPGIRIAMAPSLA